MRQPSCRGRNVDKGVSDGLECVGGKPRGFHGAMDGTSAEREPLGKLSGRDFDEDGHGLHSENTGLH